MLTLTENAQTHFRKLIEQQGMDDAGIRIQAVHGGTPNGDCQLEFCAKDELIGDEWALQCEGFVLYVDAASIGYFDQAQIDYQTNATGGQLTVRAPKLKGSPPSEGADLAERARYVIESEINPQIAAHGGRVSLEEIVDGNVLVLRFGGGCQGCGMADVTLKQGIEKTLRSRLPEITGVRDATDHASGHSPYYRGEQGSSAVR
ncbi:MAG: NfuA family Fe-S biogenesis protein [Rudaea sp.]